MIICGIKVTHDAAIALIDNGKLIFSYEMEKMDNNERHSEFRLCWERIQSIFSEFGYSFESINTWVFDGWVDGYIINAPLGKYSNIQLKLHGYDPIVNNKPVLDVSSFNPGNGLPDCHSYQHISGHIASAYCTSPFANLELSSFIVVWDGTIGAQLYYFNAHKKEFESFGILHYLYGSLYAEFANRFPPFTHYDVNHELSVPGKLMAYIANGVKQSELCNLFLKIYDEEVNNVIGDVAPDTYRTISAKVLARCYVEGVAKSFNGDDMMTSFHYFFEELLIRSLSRKLEEIPDSYSRNLCFTGGCALSIKWNSAIRSSGLFKRMWVPPFPNDSGSAIGTACCEMIKFEKRVHLDWNIFSGPCIQSGKKQFDLWQEIPCSVTELAWILYKYQEPIIFLSGRAELGPRALGHRSILAPANLSSMKNLLNHIKDRESYRPVAPICLEEDAEEVFDPGTLDPLMLYDHQIRSEWLPLIPAVAHLDNSARLQTVNKNDNPMMFDLLRTYKNISGIPLLCNTSANFKGKGFFPDVESAIKWNKCNFVWSDGSLWFKEGQFAADSLLATIKGRHIAGSSVSV